MSAIAAHVPARADEPIATSHGVPLAYEVLGLQVHLEEIVPEDEKRLDAALVEVQEFIGERLKWSLVSRGAAVEPFDPEVFEYASTYPRLVQLPDGMVITDATIDEVNALASAARGYGIACGDTSPKDHEHAQRTSFRFYGDVTRVFPNKTRITAYSVLRVTVPTDTPLDLFEDRVRRIVAALPVRWAAAGLMLSGAEDEHWREWRQVSSAYCSRHWGVDVGDYVAWTDEFYDWIRTVNWLTFLGPTMQRDLARAGVKLESSEVLRTAVGDTVMLKATEHPERGDINRLIVPYGYAAVDRLVRPRRHVGDDISLGENWSDKVTKDWLRRFERTVPR